MKRKLLSKALSVALATTLTFSAFGTSSFAMEGDVEDAEEGASVEASIEDPEGDPEGTTPGVANEDDSSEEATDTEEDTSTDQAGDTATDPEEEAATDSAEEASSFASSEEDAAVAEDSKEITLVGDGEVVTKGNCGTFVTWEYDVDTKTITIDGIGSMDDYTSYTETPWYKNGWTDYEKVVIEYSVPKIGNWAFGRNDRQYGSAAGGSKLTSVTFKVSAYGSNNLKTIGDNAFSCTNITDIVLPDSLTTIGSYAFQATRLTKVTIPENVTSIGANAFAWSDSVTELNFNTLDFEIDSGIFGRNGEVSKVTFPEGCSSIPARLFSGVPFDPNYEMVIPATVTSIGLEAFSGTGYNSSNQARPLKKLTFENGSELKEIGESAFNGTGLTGIALPDSLESIGKQAFYGSSLTAVVIPYNVEFIGDYAFGNCSSLASVSFMNPELPEVYTYYNEAAGKSFSALNQFSGCPISNISFAEGTKNIPYGLFYNANFAMETFVIPGSVEYIGDFAFCLGNGHRVNTIVIPSSVNTIKNRGISNQNRPATTLNCYCQNNAYATNWVETNKASYYLTLVSEGFKGISYSLNGGKNNSSNPISFSDETTITLLAPTKDGYTFEKWSAASGDLAYTAGSEGNPDTWTYTVDATKTGDYDVNGNLVFTASWVAGTYTIKFDAETNGGSLPVGAESTFNKTYGSAFTQEEYVAASKENAMFIGWYTDKNAGKKVEFGTSVFDFNLSLCSENTFTLYAHYQDTAGVTGRFNTITWSFNETSGKLTLNCPYDPDVDTGERGNYFTIPNFAVKKPAPWHILADRITSIDLGNVESVGQYAFMDCAITSITFPSNIDVIYSYAFFNCSKLETVNINFDKTYIQGSFVFLGCNLKRVTVGGDNTTIPDLFIGATFAPNTILTIPKEVTAIKSSAFAYSPDYEGARSIVGLAFENNSRLTSIGCAAFEGCEITELNLPNSLEEIQDWAFRKTLISEVTIPEGTNKLGVRCFAQCPNLTQVNVPASVEYVGYMYEYGSHQVVKDSEVFSNSNKKAITFIAPKDSAAYKYAEEYAKAYNYILKNPVNYVILFNAGTNDEARKGVQNGLLSIGGNALMGLDAATVAANTDLAPIKAVDSAFSEATMTSRKGFVQTVKTGDFVTLSGDEFVKPGFTLTGWKNESTGKTLKNDTSYEDLAADGKSVVLTAQWKQVKYTVKYVLNGGAYVKGAAKGISSYATSFDQITGKYVVEKTYLPNCGLVGGVDNILPADQQTVTKKGYEFVAWHTDKALTSAPVYYVGGDVFSSFTLYAEWRPVNYNVKFDANSGVFSDDPGVIEGLVPDPVTPGQEFRTYHFEYNKTYKLVSTTFKKEGYTLDSWNTMSTGKGKKYAKTAKVKNIVPVAPATETVLYAQWKPNSYKITYNLKGGKAAKAPSKFTVGKNIALPEPVKTGFTGSGTPVWKLTYTDGTEVTGALITKLATGGYTINTDGWARYDNVVLSVDWIIDAEYRAIKYNVVVHDNYTKNDVTFKDFENSSDSWYKPLGKAERTGYVFDGLNTAKNGKGYFIDWRKDAEGNYEFRYNDLTLKPGSTVHLYAIWTPINYNVIYTFKNTSRSGAPELTEVTNKNAKVVNLTKNYKLSKPSLAGYTFVSWDGNGAGLGKDKNGHVIKINAGNVADVALTGSFIENSYTVNVVSNGGVSKATNKSATIALNGGSAYLYNDAVGTDLAACLGSFVRKGNVFKGFALDSKGKKMLMYADGTEEYELKGLSTKNKAKVKVYAVWEKIVTAKPSVDNIVGTGLSYEVLFSAASEPSDVVYEVQMATNILFRAGTTTTKYVADGSNHATFSATTSGRYYFRVRQTVVDSMGNKTIGKWSKVKAIVKQ